MYVDGKKFGGHVGATKWSRLNLVPFIQSLQNLVVISPGYASELIKFWWIMLDILPIFSIQIRVSYNIDMETNGLESMTDALCDQKIRPHSWTWPLLFKVIFWNSLVSRTGETIDMEQKGYKPIVCWTHYVTLNLSNPWYCLICIEVMVVEMNVLVVAISGLTWET